MDAGLYGLFLLSSAALILVPGPAQALVLARTLEGGTRAGIWTAVGLNLGTLVHATLAGLGLSALLARSELAFALLKGAGAAYLLWMGLALWRSRPAHSTAAGPAAPQATALRLLLQGLLNGLLNPKVALFFLAFLPPFLDALRGPLWLQCLLLGGTLALLDTLYESALAALVGRARPPWQRLQRGGNRVAGLVLIGLGLRLAVQQR
ncbi:LysE family translocator [Inhella proteolytica]|uniref:LysE family translocator n=1 Tax=Inhella proteolytica TaxID=2795029 RepID=A0A931J6I4_9BURK|nr:LysE family translocator [Inhella proteolytica]MBH9579145.1 LysE family translocator [Inhella proteolytica]